MGVDIRLPIGGLFSVLGLMLTVYGIFTNGDEMYHRSLGYNVNIWWGLVMLVFGVFMLVMCVRASALKKNEPIAAPITEKKDPAGARR